MKALRSLPPLDALRLPLDAPRLRCTAKLSPRCQASGASQPAASNAARNPGGTSGASQSTDTATTSGASQPTDTATLTVGTFNVGITTAEICKSWDANGTPYTHTPWDEETTTLCRYYWGLWFSVTMKKLGIGIPLRAVYRLVGKRYSSCFVATQIRQIRQERMTLQQGRAKTRNPRGLHRKRQRDGTRYKLREAHETNAMGREDKRSQWHAFSVMDMPGHEGLRWADYL